MRAFVCNCTVFRKKRDDLIRHSFFFQKTKLIEILFLVFFSKISLLIKCVTKKIIELFEQ